MVVLSVSFGAIVALTVVRYVNHPLRKLLPGPPPTNYLLGNALQTRRSIATWQSTTDYPEPYLSWLNQYGSAVYYRELFNHTVMLSDPKALQHVLDIVMGEGLVSSEGAKHDAQRKMLNPHFTAAQVRGFVKVFEQLTTRCCATILEAAATSHTRLDMASGHPEALGAYQQLQLAPSPLLLIGMFSVPGFIHWPLPPLRRRRAAKNVLATVISDVIEHKLASVNPSSHDDNHQDLLDRILTDPTSTTNHDAVTHVMTFMTAGHETTSSSLAWVLVELAARPVVVARIRQEVHTLTSVSDHTTMSPLATWEGIHSLKYTLAVIQETMRLHSVFFQLMRRLTEQDDSVPLSDGSMLPLPKGTSINVLTSAMHLNPKSWTNPTEFTPERFMEDTPEWAADAALRQSKSHAFVYMPFSIGSKNCIGHRFAIAELLVIVATFVQNFDFALTDKANVRHLYNAMTVVPANLEMTVSRAPQSVDE
ncbi:hypothetical protein DYB34_008796 [Aphanomyces astaci]|uniref:Cytochrome P450 n=2 Tax=Aphanomyces astaci TaxID=112090 RepID=A0A3R7DEG9_APHAT|nr:hypothetical protein DYB34_008796 [Aphanomyces astaci]